MKAAASTKGALRRHRQHELHLLERINVPPDKVLCPGMITHVSNTVEHPVLIATVLWEKFQAVPAGVEFATKRLFGQ